jgi:hypothetical protein
MSRERHSTIKCRSRKKAAQTPVRATGRYEARRIEESRQRLSSRLPVGVAPANPMLSPADMPPPTNVIDRILTEADRHTRCGAPSPTATDHGAGARLR